MAISGSRSRSRSRASVRSRSRESSSTSDSDPRDKIKECVRKLVAFMCTQVGVGMLVVCYAILGAFAFMSLETAEGEPLAGLEGRVTALREGCVRDLWEITVEENAFDEAAWTGRADAALKSFQDGFAEAVKLGYDGRSREETWSFPAALMYCLSVFTMIGYGNMVPRSAWGKGATVVYASLGIPIYVLYFLNMGKVLAQTFRWLYRSIRECGRDRTALGSGSGPRPKTIVPSTACLWVITFYALVGTIIFAEWENWNYLDSTYFCVTSLCKIGFGDFVPGANILDSRSGSQTKLVINFVYVLLGMGLIAMCYDLMREDVKEKVRELGEDARQCFDDVQNAIARCFSMRKKPRESEL